MSDEARRLLERLVEIAGCSHYEGQAPKCDYCQTRAFLAQPQTSAREADGWEEPADVIPDAYKHHHASFHGECDIEGPGLKEPRDAREVVLVEVLRALVKATQPMDFCRVCLCVHSNFKNTLDHKEWCAWAKADDALADTSSAAAALLAQGEKPQIVCLCGSTRFMDTFHEVGWQKTLDGEIVLSVGTVKGLPRKKSKEELLGEDVAQALDELHKRKIDLADYVMVLNVGGYIGDSTRSEIEYAEAQGKRVDYLEARAALASGEE